MCSALLNNDLPSALAKSFTGWRSVRFLPLTTSKSFDYPKDYSCRRGESYKRISSVSALLTNLTKIKANWQRKKSSKGRMIRIKVHLTTSLFRIPRSHPFRFL
jgi:hypothetical protein